MKIYSVVNRIVKGVVPDYQITGFDVGIINHDTTVTIRKIASPYQYVIIIFAYGNATGTGPESDIRNVHIG